MKRQTRSAAAKLAASTIQPAAAVAATASPDCIVLDDSSSSDSDATTEPLPIPIPIMPQAPAPVVPATKNTKSSTSISKPTSKATTAKTTKAKQQPGPPKKVTAKSSTKAPVPAPVPRPVPAPKGRQPKVTAKSSTKPKPPAPAPAPKPKGTKRKVQHQPQPLSLGQNQNHDSTTTSRTGSSKTNDSDSCIILLDDDDSNLGHGQGQDDNLVGSGEPPQSEQTRSPTTKKSKVMRASNSKRGKAVTTIGAGANRHKFYLTSTTTTKRGLASAPVTPTQTVERNGSLDSFTNFFENFKNIPSTAGSSGTKTATSRPMPMIIDDESEFELQPMDLDESLSISLSQTANYEDEDEDQPVEGTGSKFQGGRKSGEAVVSDVDKLLEDAEKILMKNKNKPKPKTFLRKPQAGTSNVLDVSDTISIYSPSPAPTPRRIHGPCDLGSQEFNVRIRWRGGILVFPMKETDLCYNLRTKLSTQLGLKPDELLITFDDENVNVATDESFQFQDTKTLKDANILEGIVLNAVRKIREEHPQTKSVPKIHNPNLVRIKCQSADRKSSVEIHVDKKDGIVRDILVGYAIKFNVDPETIKRVIFDGDRLEPEDGLGDLDLEGGECFDIILE